MSNIYLINPFLDISYKDVFMTFVLLNFIITSPAMLYFIRDLDFLGSLDREETLFRVKFIWGVALLVSAGLGALIGSFIDPDGSAVMWSLAAGAGCLAMFALSLSIFFWMAWDGVYRERSYK